MSPRAGGEADKLGNRYESVWTINYLLRVLQGKGESVVVEDIGELADHSEFSYVDSTSTQVHQVKRQNDLVNYWTVKSLHGLGIWNSAKLHVAAGRQYHFVSMIPCRPLQELADTARQTTDLTVYLQDLIANNKRLRPVFDELSAPSVLGSAQEAFSTLRATYLSVYGEREVSSGNEAIAEVLLDGGNGRSITASLADIIVHSLRETLTRDVLVAKLAEHGITPLSASRLPRVQAPIEQANTSWRDSIQRQMIEPVIARPIAGQIADATQSDEKLILITGSAGGGKSGTILQVADILAGESVQFLGFRLDRLDSFSSTSDLGAKLGLDRSPVAALAVAAGDDPSVLLVDQLDAVSLASGRMPASLDSVADLVRESDGFPRMCVVLICRQFDVENDERIRTLLEKREPRRVSIDLLSNEEVESAVGAANIDSTALTTVQRQLLRTPFNLSLLYAIADQSDVLQFDGTIRLLDLYWERKRRDSRQRRLGVNFDAVVQAVADKISERETLSIPEIVLNEDISDDADVLVSEGILTRDGSRLAFSHESLFDYAFARAWMRRDVTLIEFFENDRQELFRRGQLRQILSLMRSADPDRFVPEIESLLLSATIRFHLKDATLAVLGSIPDPSEPEIEAINRVANVVEYAQRIWRRLSTPAWFFGFDTRGHIAEWLTSGEQQSRDVAIDFMARAVSTYPDRVSTILRDIDLDPSVTRYVLRFAQLGRDAATFNLLLVAIRQGIFTGHDHELWIDTHDLADESPERAIRLLSTFLNDRPAAFQLGSDGQIESLNSREYSAAELVRACSSRQPSAYCANLLPYILRVAELTLRENPGPGYPHDSHFGWHDVDDLHGDQLDTVLLLGAVQAIEFLAGSDLLSATPHLEQLESAELDSAQYILYAGLIAAGESYAERSASILLQSADRLFCGFRSNSVWMTRRVLQAISAHVSQDQFASLEATVRDVRFDFEGRVWSGYYAFTLLSGLAESRLSEPGRRRLGEYRRKFGSMQPPEPEGIIGGFIGPPIARSSAEAMSDDNWLSAIRSYATDRSNWQTLTGGAHELSHVLREMTKEEPLRFASLCLEFDSTVHPAYGDAVLMGIGDAEAQEESELIFRAIRHIASLCNEENDRWLGWALRPYYSSTPMDIVELIRDHALAARDPESHELRFRSNNNRMGRNSDLELTAANTVRGSLMEALGDLLVYDSDGSRTNTVTPYLSRYVADPSVAVRVSVAHLVAATLRFDRPAALGSINSLIDTDDRIFTATTMQRLLNYIGNEDPSKVLPILNRMITSELSTVREVGGSLAAFAAMEWQIALHLNTLLELDDAPSRRGVAATCADRLIKTSSIAVAKDSLEALAYDEDETVRDAVAKMAASLRGEPLRPYAATIKVLLESPSFKPAVPQILFTLEYAPDQVNDLVALCAERFVFIFGDDSSDIRTGAAGDVLHLGKLVIRALAQSRDVEERSRLLDVLDGLLLVGSYRIDELVARSERGEAPDEVM